MSMAEWRSLSTIRIRAAAVMCAPRRRRGCEVLTHAPAWRKGHCRTGFAQVFAKFLRRNPKGENSATAAVENPASAGKFCLQRLPAVKGGVDRDSEVPLGSRGVVLVAA